ncbi:sigma-E processing peptidase SpoIIGA [Phosphitispora sp. TUW77]|uniref:sigma-E processing peptidase SpoIIGA n=1 Tax=Phosphitispora sp. TUW77 TaxID=3152361 RepID=UPI003AB6C084
MEVQKVVYVYPDVAFAVSFLMNGLILWGTARVSKFTVQWPRIAAGALTGAVYSGAAAFPQMGVLYSLWFKAAFSVIMFAVVFAPLGLKRFVSSITVFYIVSFSLGGLFLGVLYSFGTSPYYVRIAELSRLVAAYFLPGLAVTVGLYLLLTRYAGRIIHNRMVRDLFRVTMKLLFGDSEVTVEALIDTGNQLQDPLSKIPVIVVEYGVLKNLFPAEVRLAFENSNDPDLMLALDSLSNTPWVTRFRVIPFCSLGKEHGMLIGFCPDRVEIWDGSKPVSIKKVIVGIYNRQLSPEGSYKALLHPEALDIMTA